jgi:ParB-like nuclease domain
MYAMARLRIAELLANAPIDPEAHLDAARVERYARTLDALPPVVVVDTPEGLLLADGYHRVAASRRLGLEEVEAEVRTGTRRDAVQQIGLALVGAAGARLATVPGLQAGQTTLLGLIRRMFPQDHAVIACLAGRQEQGSQN